MQSLYYSSSWNLEKDEDFATEEEPWKRSIVHNSPWISATTTQEWRFERIVLSYWQFPFEGNPCVPTIFSYPRLVGLSPTPEWKKAMGTGRKWKDEGRTRPGERDAMRMYIRFDETVNGMEWCPMEQRIKRILWKMSSSPGEQSFDGSLRVLS